jgi:uncharacterized paraquat-inducible protein A
MPKRDDDYQPLDPREYPEPDVGTDSSTLPCPHCLAVLHEESTRCPRCGEYLIEGHTRKPYWLVFGVLLCIAILLFGLRLGW